MAHPVQYTYNYYAQYPALGLILWPPLFHFVEGIIFLVLGPSVVSARLTTLLFALLGLTFWFKLVSELQNEWAAAVSTLLLAFLPSLLLYEKAVMLEVPSLALCIAASYFWVKYLRREESRFLYWLTLFFALALLTKQHSIYLAIFCFLTLMSERKWRLALNWRAVWAIGVCLLLVAPFYVVAFSVTWQTISDNVFNRTVRSVSPFTYYLRQLPYELGIILLVLSVIGIATCRWWGSRESIAPMLIWIVACYVTMTSFAGKEPRYMIYWLPPFVYFAVCPLTVRYRALWIRAMQVAAVSALLVIHMRSGWAYQRPYVSGYAALADYVTHQSQESGIILYDAGLHENFIFFLRTYDPARRFVVMRKALYAVRIVQERGSRELLYNASQLQGLIKRYGIKYIIVSDNSPLAFEVQKTLRELLKTPQFRLVKSFRSKPTLHGEKTSCCL